MFNVKHFLGVLLVLAGAGCARPPASSYDAAATAAPGAGLALGQNTAGESCTSQATADGADIYCGNWDQPSAHVQTAGDAGDLATLATTSSWRAALDAGYSCGAPAPGVILDGVAVETLGCTQRFGGWPHVALVARIGATVYYGDGVLPALPPLQRAIGVISGRLPAASASTAAVAGSDQLVAERLAAQAFSSGDIGHYNALMQLGSAANQAEDFPSAVIAYRAALALQQRKLGADDPGTVAPLLELGLNLSDEGRYPEAASVFAAAGRLTPGSADPTAGAKLLHYRGLDALNQEDDATALVLLRQADAAYAALLPPDLLRPRPAEIDNAALFNVAHPGGSELGADQTTLSSPVIQSALLGVIETRRYQAIALRGMGDDAGAAAAIGSADAVAEANDLAPPVLDARLERTSAALSAANDRERTAVGDLAAAAANFSQALPGSLPVAETDLLQGQVFAARQDNPAALASCRKGFSLLKSLRLGTTSALVGPCLTIYAGAATADTGSAAGLHAEMFEAAQLAQGSVTAQEIAEAAARLSTSAANPKAAAAIRDEQDASARLAGLYEQRDTLAHETASAQAAGGVTLAALDKQIAAANAAAQQAGEAVQAAAPNFGQLVQQVVPADQVLALLRPDEAFLGVTSTPRHTWLFFLHDNVVNVAENGTDDARMTGLVAAVRASIKPSGAGLAPFDMTDAATIYGATLGPFAAKMADVHELVIAPSGPLLALPFSLLPTAPADPANLTGAPWLVRQTTLAYVPAAANFVALRKIEGTSAAAHPWFGFGDFRQVTLAQAQATYNPGTCHDSAAEFAGLPNLPYAKLELAAASAVFGAGAGDELLGDDFTVPNVERANLKDYRILHFATHALLPTDLPCQDAPAIVTSAPPGAASAADALLDTDDVTNLKLDANLVVLSACNTGGGASGGEALSGLARSFFYAGARALMVTQWSVNDQISAFLVAETLSRFEGGGDGGAAGSLRAAQLAVIASAGKSAPAEIANPFFWAAFAVIGDGGAGAVQLSALSGGANPRL